MFFDRESTVVVTKLNNLSEAALTNYCQNFGKVVRCFIKVSQQTPRKEPYALVKFAEASSVAAIISHRNHTINAGSNFPPGFHANQNIQKNPHAMRNYDQLVQENQGLKHEIATLQKSLTEAQAYSKTAYDTFQVLREKYEAEQALTNKLKEEHTALLASCEAQKKQAPTTAATTTETEKVKDEPIDCDTREAKMANHALEVQIVKDRLEQAQIDLGKCQTENAILNAKLNSREQQFDARHRELNQQYLRLKKQHEHITSCVKDFHAKMYPRRRVKAEVKDENGEKAGAGTMDDSNDDIVEIVMQVDSSLSTN